MNIWISSIPTSPPSSPQGNSSAVHSEVSPENSLIQTRALLLDPSDPGVASCPAVVAEVIVRHPLGPVRLTEYRSPWEKQEQPGA